MSNNADKDRLITWDQVAKHNKDDDLWIVIGDNVYDVTQYSLQHPGGPIVLQGKAGRHATMAFESASHSDNAKNNILPKLKIGRIDHNSPIQQFQKQMTSSPPNIMVTVGMIAVILAIIYFIAA